jgi:hypothetical protein
MRYQPRNFQRRPLSDPRPGFRQRPIQSPLVRKSPLRRQNPFPHQPSTNHPTGGNNRSIMSTMENVMKGYNMLRQVGSVFSLFK